MLQGNGIKWVLIVCMLVGFGAASFAQTGEEPTIKIGAVFAITGKASWLGEPEANTVRMMAGQINEAGGINGRKLELIVKDSQGQGDRAVNAVRELIREDVVAIVGPSRSGTSMAVASICEEEQVPLISCAALAQIVEPEPGKVRAWVFKTPHKDSHVVQRIYEHMQAQGMTKVALITGTTGFGAGGRTKLQESAKDFGIEVVADETYGPADTDMTMQLLKIKAKNPDALVNWSIVPAQSIMMKNMQQLGITAQLYQSHGFGNYAYLKAAGDAAEGVIFPAGRALVADKLPEDHVQYAVLTKLKQDYESQFEDPLSTFAGHAFDALMIAVEAAKRLEVDPSDLGAYRQALRDEIEATDGFVGTGGVFRFSPADHTGLEPDSLELLTVKDGKFAILGD